MFSFMMKLPSNLRSRTMSSDSFLERFYSWFEKRNIWVLSIWGAVFGAIGIIILMICV